MPTLFQARGLPAAIVALVFAIIARVLGSVTDGGAVAGMVMAFVLILAAGWAGFAPLIAVFVIAMVTTHWGYSRKRYMEVAERSGGRRASQILANLAAAALCALAVVWFPQFTEILMVGAMAAFAEAAADTASSEIGQAVAKNPYMITDFREVPVGTNGAISVEGTLSGFIAASLVAWVGAGFGLVSWRWTPVIVLAGVGGMLLDSVLGATWENTGRIGNDTVNFVSTVFAADVGLTVAMLVQSVSG